MRTVPLRVPVRAFILGILRRDAIAHTWTRLAAFLSLILLCPFPATLKLQVQRPVELARQDNAGFYPGWMLGTRFEGSTSGDGSVYDLGTGVGYNFFASLRYRSRRSLFFRGHSHLDQGEEPKCRFRPWIWRPWCEHKILPAGKATITLLQSTLLRRAEIRSKGFSTGHATWNWSNHLEHAWGDFTPYIDSGVGNTVSDTRISAVRSRRSDITRHLRPAQKWTQVRSVSLLQPTTWLRGDRKR